MLKTSAGLSCSFGLFGLSGMSYSLGLSSLVGNQTNSMNQINQIDQRNRINPTDHARSVVWRRRAGSNRCIAVLQTAPLTTWVRRPEHIIVWARGERLAADAEKVHQRRSRFALRNRET
jgi:hypothetical protein